MKSIRIKALRLLNFCGVRNASYEFSDELTYISGGNGVGKTTVANAITYVLFGTDLKGNALDIKTYDADHNIIPEIPHSAELFVVVDGEGINLKRTLTDSWKGQVVKNTYKYFVDGEVTTAGDFKKKVDAICNETIFRLCSSSAFFLSKPWAEQRAFLQTLVPTIEVDAITGGDGKFDFVVEALKKESIDKIVGHLRYNRKEIQEQLDDVPTRLAELNKALPRKLDWDSLKEERAKLGDELNSLLNESNTIKNGGADMVRKEGIRKRIEFANKRKDMMYRSAVEQADDAAVKHGSDLINARTELKKAQSVVDDLKAVMGGYTETETHAKDGIEDVKKKVSKLNEQKENLEKLEWEWNDKDSFCPHCGQALPLDKLMEIKQKSLEKFNEAKADGNKKLNEMFAKYKDTYKELKGLLKEADEGRTLTTNKLKEAHQKLNDAEKHLQEIQADEPKSYSMILDEKEEYQKVLQEIAELNEELEKPSEENADTTERLEEIEEQQRGLAAKILELDKALAKEESYNHISNLIAEAQEDKKKYQAQIDELDDKLSVASEYQQNSCKMLEDEVNKHFNFVKWSMFQTNIDGEKKPYCECYHDGVPYSKLNSAAKVNAGIDIAYTISKHYNVSVPIILDECESNLHPIVQSNSQQIRFYVTHDEKLKVETHLI